MAKDTVAKVKKLFLMQPTLAAEMSEIKRMKASGHQLSPECLSHYAQVENMYNGPAVLLSASIQGAG